MHFLQSLNDAAARFHGWLRSHRDLPPVAARLAHPAASRLATARELAVAIGLPPAMAERVAAGLERRHIAFVDFSRPASQPRLFVFDMDALAVEQYFVTHGVQSERPAGAGISSIFSNAPGSNCSSLGLYRCAEPYQGRHGLSLRLDGLEATNDNARRRNVTLHGASYVSRRRLARAGSIGCSDGCFAVDYRFSRHLVRALAGGSLMLAFHGV